MTISESLRVLSDQELLDETLRLSTREREATAGLIAALAELDARRLYLPQGYSSLFAYCTRGLRLSEHAALNRIEAARAARAFPIIVDRIGEGALTLTAVRLLRPILTSANLDDVIAKAHHKTTKEIEMLVATMRPLPPVPSTVRKLPALGTAPPQSPIPEAPTVAPASAQPPASPTLEPASRRPVVKPLSAEHYRLQITLSLATHDKLRKAQALMRHRVPNGDAAAIFDQALDALLREVEKSRCAQVARPRTPRKESARGSSRHIPASVKREVWTRDAARCAFRSADGRRCNETNFLELHHVVPYARGGKATAVNIELRCRAHNAFEAERDFGLFVREDAPGVSLLTDGGPHGGTR